MRIALLGRGRMGAEVARLARAAGDEIALELDIDTNPDGVGLTREALSAVDVAIDFSEAAAVVPNVERTVAAGVPIVVGTTGWDADRARVREIVEVGDGALVHAANFSVGVHVLRQLVAQAARLFDRFPEYDPYVLEHHHRGKRDAPSGTALRLAEDVIGATERKVRVETAPGAEGIALDAVSVASLRAGASFGHHEVGFDSPADLIRISHTARGREGFARGALVAAAWLRGRRGFYDFAQILEEGGTP